MFAYTGNAVGGRVCIRDLLEKVTIRLNDDPNLPWRAPVCVIVPSSDVVVCLMMSSLTIRTRLPEFDGTEVPEGLKRYTHPAHPPRDGVIVYVSPGTVIKIARVSGKVMVSPEAKQRIILENTK